MKKQVEENKLKNNSITIHNIFWYVVIFSIVGLLIETFYCYITTGVLESRKGLLWGPFCPVYGIGATVLIVLLKPFKNHPLKLFIFGAILGGIVEYILSYMLEAVYGTRFWEYSYLPFDINGRICATYSIFWGILSFGLVLFVEPFLSHMLAKIPTKINSLLEKTLLVFFIFDAIATVWGVSIYKEKAMNVYYQNEVTKNKTSIISWIESTFFSDKMMKKTFPNLRFMDHNGKEIWIKDII